MEWIFSNNWGISLFNVRSPPAGDKVEDYNSHWSKWHAEHPGTLTKKHENTKKIRIGKQSLLFR